MRFALPCPALLRRNCWRSPKAPRPARAALPCPALLLPRWPPPMLACCHGRPPPPRSASRRRVCSAVGRFPRLPPMLPARLPPRLVERTPARRPPPRTQRLPSPTFTRLKRLLRKKLLLTMMLFRPQPGFHPHPRQPPPQKPPTAIPIPNERALALATPVYGGYEIAGNGYTAGPQTATGLYTGT